MTKAQGLVFASAAWHSGQERVQTRAVVSSYSVSTLAESSRIPDSYPSTTELTDMLNLRGRKEGAFVAAGRATKQNAGFDAVLGARGAKLQLVLNAIDTDVIKAYVDFRLNFWLNF